MPIDYSSMTLIVHICYLLLIDYLWIIHRLPIDYTHIYFYAIHLLQFSGIFLYCNECCKPFGERLATIGIGKEEFYTQF